MSNDSGSDRPPGGPPPPPPGNFGPPPPGGPYGPPPAPMPFQGPQPYGYQQAAPQQNTKALIALVLACVGVVTCVVLSIVALVLAGKGKREIDESNGWQTGAGMVTAARVISWIGIALWIVFTIVYAIFLIALISSSGSSYTYQY